MKDDAQDSRIPADLPPCPNSSQCLRFIDELSDATSSLHGLREDAQDQKILARLREHVPTCSTCTATIANANKVIAQQRRSLRSILDEGENSVPSTTASIMAAIRQEQRGNARTLVGVNNHAAQPLRLQPEMETPVPILPRRRFRGGLVALVAVAVLLISSFSVLSYVLPRPSSGTSSSAPAVVATRAISTSTVANSIPTVPATTSGWSAVVMTYRINGTTVIANYDPVQNKSTTLTTSPFDATSVAGVSHLGNKVLYSTYDGFKTSYYLYPQSTTNAIYTTPDKNSSAVWSTDDNFIFINTSKGVAQINVLTHAVSSILPAIATTALNDYRDGFLYFVKGYHGQVYATQGTLERVNVTSGDIQVVTPSTCQRGSNFWLSPGGITVYYNCHDQQDTNLYSIGSDGTNPAVFRYNSGNVIGYAGSIGAPLIVTNINNKYQVEQLDLRSALNDSILLNDMAPGATVMANDIAVAPYGYGLVAKGTYKNSAPTTEKLWYYDLLTTKSLQLHVPQDAQSPTVVGWDKLQVS